MMPLRLVIELPEGPRRVTLPDGEHVLGSAEDCRVRIPHMTVSRRHARLRIDGEALWVEDLGSSNGTTWDSSPVVGEAKITVPAALSFGGVVVRVASVADKDLIAAISLTSDTGPIDKPASSPFHTVSSRALEDLTLRRLPPIVDELSAGRSAAEAAVRIGTDLFHALPCHILEIWRATDDGPAILFAARSDKHPRTSGSSITGQADDLRFRAELITPSLGKALTPLAELALRLVLWSDRTHSARSHPTPGAEPSQPPESSGQAPRPLTVDPQLHRLYERAERVADSDIGILIRGESGTGKEVAARFIHRSSRRSSQAFVAINCAALPRDLLELELFGIERGVATGVEERPGKFEAAHDGTLFLDEIGDMALETQAKILRVLQEGETYRLGGREPRPAKPRILAATHKNLEELVESGELRRDLYFRLAGWTLELPPLRRRLVDLPSLAASFLAEEASRDRRRIAGISLSALEALRAYHWPGNIRELRHEIRRAALFLDDGELLDRSLLSPEIASAGPPGNLKDRLEQFERDEIRAAVLLHDGDVPQAAVSLGVGRSTLYRRMKVLGLKEEDLIPSTDA